VHTYFLRSRKKWFEQAAENQVVLWWIRAGNTPSVEDGREKLRCLQENTLRLMHLLFRNHLTAGGIHWHKVHAFLLWVLYLIQTADQV
jgi:hypothetical protein